MSHSDGSWAVIDGTWTHSCGEQMRVSAIKAYHKLLDIGRWLDAEKEWREQHTQFATVVQSHT